MNNYCFFFFFFLINTRLIDLFSIINYTNISNLFPRFNFEYYLSLFRDTKIRLTVQKGRSFLIA